MVPTAKNYPTGAVDDRGEGASGSMVDHEQVAGGGLQAPQARHRRRFLVFVQLRIEVRFPAPGPIAGENDAVIRTINRSDVVEVGRLVRHFGNHRRGLGISELRDFIELPGPNRPVVKLSTRPADDHAEYSLLTTRS